MSFDYNPRHPVFSVRWSLSHRNLRVYIDSTVFIFSNDSTPDVRRLWQNLRSYRHPSSDFFLYSLENFDLCPGNSQHAHRRPGLVGLWGCWWLRCASRRLQRHESIFANMHADVCGNPRLSLQPQYYHLCFFQFPILARVIVLEYSCYGLRFERHVHHSAKATTPARLASYLSTTFGPGTNRSLAVRFYKHFVECAITDAATTSHLPNCRQREGESCPCAFSRLSRLTAGNWIGLQLGESWQPDKDHKNSGEDDWGFGSRSCS